MLVQNYAEVCVLIHRKLHLLLRVVCLRKRRTEAHFSLQQEESSGQNTDRQQRGAGEATAEAMQLVCLRAERLHTNTAESWFAGTEVFWLMRAWKRLKLRTEWMPTKPRSTVSPPSSWKKTGYCRARGGRGSKDRCQKTSTTVDAAPRCC